MARFHFGVENALDPITEQALRQLPDHYHVLVGFNVPRTTRMAEALVLRLAGDQSSMFMVGALRVDAPVRGSAHGPWDILIDDDPREVWEPYDTPLGDTNPLLGLQYTANKAQDWIAANLPALEDPLHPWPGDVRPQVFPRLLILSEYEVDVERHSWVWYFTETQQIVEHLEAWRPRDPFPITPAVLRSLVLQFGLEPEEPWDDRPVDISVEALRDIQREWTQLGEDIRDLRTVLAQATDALGAIRTRGRLIDEALRHLARGVAMNADSPLGDDDDDESTPIMRSHEFGEDEPEEPPRKRVRMTKVRELPKVGEPEPEPEPEPEAPKKRRSAKAVEPEPASDDDGGDDDAPPPVKRRRKVAEVEAPAAEAPKATRGRKAKATEANSSWDESDAPEMPVTEARTIHIEDSGRATAPEASAPAPSNEAAVEVPASIAAVPKVKTVVAKAPTPDEDEADDEPVDYSRYAPTMAGMGGGRGGFAPTPPGFRRTGLGESFGNRFRAPMMQRPAGLTTGKEPLRLLPAAVRGLPHTPTARSAARIEAAFRRTMPHFALGPFGYPSFEAFLLTAVEAGVIRGGEGTYWLPEESPLPPMPGAGIGMQAPSPVDLAIGRFLGLPTEQQRWVVVQMVEIEKRARFLTQRYVARGLTYGRPPLPLSEREAEELVFAGRKLGLLEEIESSFEDGPRFTLKVNLHHPFVRAALSGEPLPALEEHANST